MPLPRSAVRFLIQMHRWLGLVAGLVAVMWFATGIAMIYVGGMPALSPEERLDGLEPLRLERVSISPADAAGTGGAIGRGAPSLLMVQQRPAYQFAGAPAVIVFADDGTVMQPADASAAAEVARRFIGTAAATPRLVRRLDAAVDQWTLSHARTLPLLKFAADDPAGTELYVSLPAAQVVQVTTRASRAKAWLATIPHWLYFSALRQHQQGWSRLVVTLSTLVCALAVLGLVLAFTQWRRFRPFSLARAIPYRGGMRWHYVSGALFGLFVLTWGFSGLLSMEPFAWTRVPELQVPSEALGAGPPDLRRFDIAASSLASLAAPRVLKEVAFRRMHDGHFYVLRSSARPDAAPSRRGILHATYGMRSGNGSEMLVDAMTRAPPAAPPSREVMLSRLRAALPGMNFRSVDQLDDYDDYYYSRSGQLALPVLRVRLDDALQTWLYVDPATGDIVGNVHRYSRVERWLYNGLHSLDFRFWYSRRPLWDLAMLTLLLGGLAASSLGLFYGVRRLIRS